MADVRVHIGPGDQIEIQIGYQHLSRITHAEVRSLIAMLLTFGGKQLREEIGTWLSGGKIDSIAEVISPEPTP